MYTIHTIGSFYIIHTFEFAFKRMLTEFFFINISFVKLLHLISIDFIINVLMCFIFNTYFFFLLQDDLITLLLDYSIVLWLSSKLFLIAGSYMRSLIDPPLAYLEPKSPKTLNSSDEFPEPLIRQVSCNLSLV